MCSYIIDKVRLKGSAKGQGGWLDIDTANVYFDHPWHASLDHALGIDFVNEKNGAPERIAVELSAESAKQLALAIMVALKRGEAEHGEAA